MQLWSCLQRTKKVFFTEFSPEGTRFCPWCTRFFSRENQSKSRGKPNTSLYTSRSVYISLHGWAQNGISRFGPTTQTTSTRSTLVKCFSIVELNWSDLISQFLANVMANFCSGDFLVWEAPVSLKQCIEVILGLELKQSYCYILESDKTILKFSSIA